MTNPYNKVNLRNFILRKLGLRGNLTVYLVEQGEKTGFDMCVFRDHLVRFLADELEGEWHVRNRKNDLEVRLELPFDIQRVRDNFRVV